MEAGYKPWPPNSGDSFEPFFDLGFINLDDNRPAMGAKGRVCGLKKLPDKIIHLLLREGLMRFDRRPAG